MARLYALAGESDRALEWLEKGFEEHEPRLAYMGVAKVWDDLRDHPRFKSLLRRMNLPV